MFGLSKKLIQKSNDAFLLALELFNKPTINYRTESFSLFFSNCWELLLKAYLLEQNGGKRNSIFKKKKRNQKRESISLDECLNKIFSNNDPVRKNIEFISEIRNESAHLIIQELDPYFSRAFQSGINNYVSYLHHWFKIDINQRLSPGLISLVSDKNKIADLTVLKKHYGKEDFESIIGWVNKFDELAKLGENAALSIKHTVAIVRNPNKADFVISSGQISQRNAVIVERTKDPDLTHPYNRTVVMGEISQRIPNSTKFNLHDFEAYVFAKGYKKSNNDYFYKGKYSGSAQYSKKFIDELVQNITINNHLFDQWRDQYKKHLLKK